MKKLFLRRLYYFIGAIILIAIVAGGWSLKSSGSADQIAPKMPAVKTVVAKEAEKNIPLEISGFVRGEERADIAPMMSGRILRILKHEGEPVKKGELLAVIESAQADAQVAAAGSSVAALQKTLGEGKRYYDQLVDQAKAARDDADSDTADEAVDSARRARDLQLQIMEGQLVAAQGALDIARSGKNYRNLVAPFAGTITAVSGREGGFANFSMPLISLSTGNSFEIETYVSASDARKIFSGLSVALQTPDGIPLSGTITAIAPGAVPSSLKTLVRIHIDGDGKNIRLGDYLYGQIMLPREKAAVSIPRGAVVSRGGDKIVFLADENDVVREQPIKTGYEYDGSVEILEGITAGQRIVAEGQQYLLNGITVKTYATE